MSLRNGIIFFIGLYFAVLVWWLSIFVSGSKVGTINNIFGLYWTLSLLIVSLVALFWSFRVKNKVTNFYLLLGLMFLITGIFVWNLGNLVWDLYNIFDKVEIPYPSMADALYLSSYPFLIVGAFDLFSNISRPNIRMLKTSVKARLLFILLYFAILLLYLTIFFQYLYGILTILYVIFDVFMISLSVLIILRKFSLEKLSLSLLLLLGSQILQLGGDLLFLYQMNFGGFYNGGLVDFLFLCFGFLGLLGVLLLLDKLYPPYSHFGLTFGPTFLIQLPYARQISLNYIDLYYFVSICVLITTNLVIGLLI